MTATFSISSDELDQSIIERIRSITQGRSFKVFIRLEEEVLSANVEHFTDQVAERALIYSKTILSTAKENQSAVEAIVQQYKNYRKIDFSQFKFNREDANER